MFKIYEEFIQKIKS